jgi:hypothetical protein
LRLRLRNFVIPNFPLGALLALGLFGFGFVFAFPDDSYIWLWELVIAIAVLLWSVGAGLFAASLPNDVKEAPESDEKGKRRSDDEGKGCLSPSFSSLVDAINAHSRANIAEERKEDYERALRERITIVLLSVTMLAIVFQVIEMKRVYEPIRQQGETAIIEKRAWIGPSAVNITDEPIIDQPIKTSTAYVNTGKSPAGLFNSIIPYNFSKNDWENGTACQVLINFKNFCMGSKEDVSIQTTVWPSTGFSSYTLAYPAGDTTGPVVKNSIALQGGEEIFALAVCFVYKDLIGFHHTVTCSYASAGRVRPATYAPAEMIMISSLP